MTLGGCVEIHGGGEGVRVLLDPILALEGKKRAKTFRLT